MSNNLDVRYEQVSDTDTERVTRLWGNTIVREGHDDFQNSFYAMLFTQGYRTVTTKKRINEVINSMGWWLNQVKGEWFLYHTKSGNEYPFSEGCKVYVNGLFVDGRL